MNIHTAAAREYASRPADERYPSVDTMVAAALEDKNRSLERMYSLKDLQVKAETIGEFANGDANRTLMLASPKGSAKFTHWSFGQLCRSLGAPASYLRGIPVELAADCLNYGLQQSPAGTDANLLVRAPNGDPYPTLRACTTDTYGRVWDAPLYAGIRDQILSRDDRWQTPPTWTGEPAGAYRGDRDSFLIVVNGGSIVADPSLKGGQRTGPSNPSIGSGPSDGMYRGILVRNSEVGACAVQIEEILFRYVCGNHLIWGAVGSNSFRRRHVGQHAMRDTIREIGRLAWKLAQASPARDEAIIRSLIDHEIAQTKDAVVDELRKMGASKDQAEQAYQTAERTESASPRSYWGVAQGLTRNSQQDGWQDDRLLLDQLAAKVLQRGAQLVRV